MISISRSELRSQTRQARRALTEIQQASAADDACLRLLATTPLSYGDKLALYLTNDGELDTTPLINALWHLGVELYLPRLHPFSAGNLIFIRYQPHTPMVSNQYGILEPKLNIEQMISPNQLDVIVAPLVAFDDKGNRMGMGGGYYDRTLATRRIKQQPIAIGYAHTCQQVATLPCEYWDIPLEMIITPEQVFDFR